MVVDLKYRYIFFSAIIVYFLTYLVTGRIPVGWDGGVYLSYVQSLADGVIPQKDPYRLARVSAFAPALLMSYFFDMGGEEILIFQSIFNVITLSGSACLFYAALRKLNSQNPLFWTAILFVAYPYLVMPVYYPMLTDHVALSVGCLAVWLWSNKKNNYLLVLVFFSALLHPGLFLIPLMLCAFPRELDARGGVSDFFYKSFHVIFYIFSVLIVAWVVYGLTQLRPDEVASHGRHKGMLQLRPFSMACAVTMLLVFFYLIEKNFRVLLSSLSWSRLFFAVASVISALLCVYWLTNWGEGNAFKGPPLLKYMGLQVLAAPFKPLIAHFLNFGVVFVLYMYLLFAQKTENVALLATSLLFLSLLSFGSESRQWLGFYPVMVAFVAVSLNKLNELLKFVFLFTSVLLLIPAFFLKECVPRVIGVDNGFKTLCSQTYFGKQGPWMSQDVYVLGTSLLLVVLFVLLLNRGDLDMSTSEKVMDKNEINHSQ